MGGGLLQLVAQGAQDAYLSGNPQITFWKGLFKRHTNFAMESFRINFTGQPNWGTKQTAIVGRHADLLYSTQVEVQLPAGGKYNNPEGRLGYNLIEQAELDIGGQIIDRQQGEFLYLWDTLTSEYSQSLKLWRMVGTAQADGPITIPTPSGCSPLGSGRPGLPTTVQIPLYFFFTRNPGCALPLISLQYHEVKINILWNDPKFIAGDFTQISTDRTQAQAPSSAALYIDYIYLDTEERRRMAQNSHEYLIEQTQFNEDQGITSANNRIDLTFNHPVKELIWVVQPSDYTDCKLPKSNVRATQIGTNGTRLTPFTQDVAAIYQQSLQINGQDRTDNQRQADYFSRVQPYQHHTGLNQTIYGGSGVEQKGLYCYSFALRPEEHQPSGTCNFSRIDTATIVMSLNGSVSINQDTDATFDVRVYAINYNILRIMSGMAGLAQSN